MTGILDLTLLLAFPDFAFFLPRLMKSGRRHTFLLRHVSEHAQSVANFCDRVIFMDGL